MTDKSQIVEELGELLLPNLVNQGLAANDRAKYLLTLLQTARDHAAHPEFGSSNLESERIAAGVTESRFDNVTPQSRMISEGLFRIPLVADIHQQIIDAIGQMLAPLKSAGAVASRADSQDGYEARLEKLRRRAPDLREQQISGVYIDQVTSAQPDDGDSLHLLVMNLHKELNRLQSQISSESIEEARVYGLDEDDRSLVAAFMRGLNRTRQLKFDHPGLGTTATRVAGKLVIQNDIGTTDAHVIVIHVAPPQVTVTYTDIHIQRLVFFQNLFKRFDVRWKDTLSKYSAKLDEAMYHLCTGVYDAPSRVKLEEYLALLGSRLVFLIDWNRARKRLRRFAPKRVCLEVLAAAADEEYGHMGFLKLGGEHLIFDALQLAASGMLQVGGQLSDLLGNEKTAQFLKFTLRTAAEGLLSGRSELLIHDQVRAELRNYFETAHQGLLDMAADHASLIVELAEAASDVLLTPGTIVDAEHLHRVARRAKIWEHRADELLNKVRSARVQFEQTQTAKLLRIADDAADELEEAIFLLTLQSSQGDHECLGGLRKLARLAVQGAQEYLKAVATARLIQRASSREEMADFLAAVDRIISLEHQSDDAHRQAKAKILDCAVDFKQFHLCAEIADRLEQATDALMRSALILKDYVLGDVIAR